MSTLAAIFSTIARQQPAGGPRQATAPQNSPKTAPTTCPLCETPLKPGRTHVLNGFECREAQERQA